jgi:hypothetical protein
MTGSGRGKPVPDTSPESLIPTPKEMSESSGYPRAAFPWFAGSSVAKMATRFRTGP